MTHILGGSEELREKLVGTEKENSRGILSQNNLKIREIYSIFTAIIEV